MCKCKMHNQEVPKVDGHPIRGFFSVFQMLLCHGQRLHYTIVRTPNTHEAEQGSIAKIGNGGADVRAVGMLCQAQVYQLADYLDIPETVISTTDPYIAERTQEDFFNQLPFELTDLIWCVWDYEHKAEEVAAALDYSPVEIKKFKRKRNHTAYLRKLPIFHWCTTWFCCKNRC